MVSNKPSRKSRRKVIKALGATAVTGAMAGCAGDDGEDTEGTDDPGDDTNGNGGTTAGTPSNGEWPDLSGRSLHYVGAEGSAAAQAFWSSINSAFTEATGAAVNMEYAGTVTGDRLAQLIQAGDPPELYNGTEVQAANLAVQGAVEPLTDVMDLIIEELGEPYDFQRVVVDGEDYYAPFFGNTSQFWYRTDLGIDVVPDTWDNVLEYAGQAHELDETEFGTVVSAGPGFDTQRTALTWAWSAGGQVTDYDSNDEIQIEVHGEYRDNWIEALEFMDNLHEYSPTASDSGWSLIGNAIQSELAACNWYGGGRPIQFAVENDRSFASNVRSVITPENQTRLGQGSGNGIIIPSNSDDEAAKVYLEFLMTSAERVLDLTFDIAPVHNAPVWDNLRDFDYYQEKVDALPDEYGTVDDQLQTSLVDAPANAMSYPTEVQPPNPYAGALADSLLVSEMVQEVLLNDVDPGQAVDTYGTELQQVLDDTRGN